MAIRSMTGFGRGEASNETYKVTAELGSVNRKQFDCSVTLPRELACLEADFQKLVHSYVNRGYIKGAVTLETVSGGYSAASLDGIRKQVESLRLISSELGLKDTLTSSDLLRIPDILRLRLSLRDSEELWPLIQQAATAALEEMTKMREREGAELVADLRQRFNTLHGMAGKIRDLAPRVPVAYRAALERRLNELLQTGGEAIDQALVAREVAVFADRCDISEELTRLESHFMQAEKIFAEEAACGRTLDFLCQEFFREINTIGSKANDAEIAKFVIALKAGVEAIREQVQNLE